MSWFPKGITNLTGQLGNFTREVLNEGTEEVDDLGTELKLMKSKVLDLTLQNFSQKKELEKIKHVNEEMALQLESKEYLVQKIIRSHRETLDKKEVEIKGLQNQMEILKRNSAKTPDWLIDETDTIPHNILPHTSTPIKSRDNFSENAALLSKIEALQNEKTHHLDKHQHELTSIRDNYSQNLALLKKQHNLSIEVLKSKIAKLEEKVKEEAEKNSKEDLKVEPPSMVDEDGSDLEKVNEALKREVEKLNEKLKKMSETSRNGFKDASMEGVLDEKETEQKTEANVEESQNTILLQNEIDKLQTRNEDLIKKLDGLNEQVKELQERKSKMENDWVLAHAMEKRQSALLTQTQQKLDAAQQQVLDLKEQLSKVVNTNDENLSDRQLLATENNELMYQLEKMKIKEVEYKKKFLEMENKFYDLEKVYEKERKKITLDERQEEVIKLKKDLMQCENEKLEEIDTLENKLQEIDRGFKEEVGTRRKIEEEKDEIERECEKMKKKLEESNVRVAQLEDALKYTSEKFGEMRRSKEALECQLSMERTNQQSMAVLERDALKSKVSFFKNLVKEVETVRDSLKEEIKSKEEEYGVALKEKDKEFERVLKEKDEKCMEVLKEKEQLVIKIEELHSKSTYFNTNNNEITPHENHKIEFTNQNNNKSKESSQDIGISLEEDKEIKRLKVEVEELKSKLEESEEVSRLYEEEVARLEGVQLEFQKIQELNKELADHNTQLNENGKKLEEMIEGMQKNVEKSEVENSTKSVENPQKVKDLLNENSQLKDNVKQQSALVKTLNDKYTSLLEVLDGRSLKQHGDKDVMRQLHDLQLEVETLHREREHMTSVLGDKTAEASALKKEVVRLMDALSATQGALDKVHKDTYTAEDEGEDMKKQAIKQLSQLIKEKDMEIGALNQKNNTLLQVLQSESADGMSKELRKLVSERDALQLKLSNVEEELQNTRTALHHQQQESLQCSQQLTKYKQETQLLNKQMENLQTNHKRLCEKLEDKQKNLLKLLDQLASFRNKTTNKYNLGEEEEEEEAEKAEDGFEEVDGLISGMVGRLAKEKEAVIMEKEKVINELEKQLLMLQNKADQLQLSLNTANNHVLNKDIELSGNKKQIERLQRSHEGDALKLKDLQEEIEGLNKKLRHKNEEISLLQQASSLSLSSNCTTPTTPDLQSPVPNTKDIEEGTNKRNNENDKISSDDKPQAEAREAEMMRILMILQQERNNLISAMHLKQQECLRLTASHGEVEERAEKLMKDVERLKKHMVKVEEAYTREAIEAESREKDLRKRLLHAEDRVQSLTQSAINNKSDLGRQTENLQTQLHSMAEQRDNALMQLSSAQETISSYSTSLSNLQMVLEQFQSERTHAQSLEVERFQLAFNKKQVECQQLQERVQELLLQLEEHTEAIKAAQRLSEQMHHKEHLLAALKDEVHERELKLRKTEDEVKKLTSSADSKIDKILMKSLLIGYFHAPVNKRPEAFQVIAHVLNFSKDELKNIDESSSSSSSWLKGLFKAPPPPVNNNLNQSFAELFVSFLERESTPLPDSSQTRKIPTLPAPVTARKTNPFSVPATINSFNIPHNNLLNLPPTNPIISPSTNTTLIAPTTHDTTFISAQQRQQLRESFVPIVVAAASSTMQNMQ